MASTVIGSYDPEEMEILIDALPVTGFGEGQVVISRDNNIVNKKVGFQGEVHLETNADRTGTLTIPLKAMSTWDQTLNELQGLVSLGVTQFLVTISIPSHNILINTVGWLEVQPDIGAGAELADREHVIGLANTSPSLINQGQSLASQVQSWLV
jgi:hypothetical protein